MGSDEPGLTLPFLLIGGQGERKTLRLVAEQADMWHGFTTSAHPGKAAVLAEHCAARQPRP